MILAQSDALLDEQLRRYGVTTHTEQRLQDRGGKGGWREVPQQVAEMGQTPDTASLATAARAIAASRARLRALSPSGAMRRVISRRVLSPGKGARA